MRQISDAALAKILETQGSDPIILVQIFWTETNSIIYGDRAFTPQIKGCLLDVGDIENVVNSAAGSNSGSVSLRLDDTDGSIKGIMDSMDIHKRPVYILQWFPELPLSDAFILFDGVIQTPITWKEGERTLSFDVLSKIESLEVGYSAEEGNFEYIPPNLVGKAWPLIFGTVLHVPAVQINEIPSGFSNEDTGINAAGHVTGPLKNFGENERKNVTLLEELERECFTMAAILLGEASTLDEATVNSIGNAAVGLSGGGTSVNNSLQGFTTSGVGLSGSLFRHSDNPVAQQLFDLGTQFEQKGNEYRTERLTFNPNNNNFDASPDQNALEKNQLRITGGAKFPQKTNIIITINGAQHEGYFEGEIFTIISRTHPFTDQGAVAGPTEVIDRAVATEFKTDLAAQTFFYAVAGSLVGMGPSTYPVYYIVGIPFVTNIVVLARKRDGTINKYVVPSNYYSIQYSTFGTLQATLVVMSRPLSTRAGEKWEDEIWVNCVSPLGSNAATIIEYLVEHYTDESIDPVTFDAVRTLVNPYQMGFAILDRKNALEVIKEIAYQARCAVWFKGGRFYLKYLPLLGDPVDTIVEADVESGTMEVSGTDTEDLVTKWTVEWASKLDQTTKNRIIYRYHVKKYGLISEDYDCYAFNNQKLVEKFALFWLIRKANTWKRLKFSTFLTKLRLEPFDSVLINFTYPWVNDPGCVNPTIGIIEKASYNSDTSRIELEIWLPIRFGEMCPYEFAYPSGLDVTKIFPQENDPGIQNDIPGAGATGSLYDQGPHTGVGTPNVTPQNFGSGGGVPVGDSGDSGNPELNPPVELNPADMVNTGNGLTSPTGAGTANTTPTVSQRIIKKFEPSLTDLGDAVFPGIIIKQSALRFDTYEVNVYFDGLSNPAKKINVVQVGIDIEDEIPPETPTMVTRNVQRNDKGLISGVEYTMQVPIWLKPKDPNDTATPDLTPQSDQGTQSSEPPLAPPETDEGDE